MEAKHKEFFDELQALLKKYDVEITTADEGAAFATDMEIWFRHPTVVYRRSILTGDESS